MRTTLNIDADVLEKARAISERQRSPFRHVVNEALRTGLDMVQEPPPSKPYQTGPRRMGLKAGKTLDNIQELIAQVEGEQHL